jgi:hypothetical protein
MRIRRTILAPAILTIGTVGALALGPSSPSRRPRRPLNSLCGERRAADRPIGGVPLGFGSGQPRNDDSR